jgi:hypothetical protein
MGFTDGAGPVSSRRFRYVHWWFVGLAMLTCLLMAASFAFQSGAYYGSTHWAVCPPQDRYAIACDGAGRCFRLDRHTGEVTRVGSQ